MCIDNINKIISDLKTILLNMITTIINSTQPTPIFKKNFEWNIYDCERLYKTQPLYYLLNLIEGKEE